MIPAKGVSKAKENRAETCSGRHSRRRGGTATWRCGIHNPENFCQSYRRLELVMQAHRTYESNGVAIQRVA